MSIPFALSQDVTTLYQPIRVAYLRATIENGPPVSDLSAALGAAGALVKAELGSNPASSRPEIQACRRFYKALGKDPSRYRPSAEALTRRVVQGKALYNISAAVDVTNLISLKSGISIGAYDCTAISGSVIMRGGREGEPYEAIGRGPLNIANLPVFADNFGPFGSPTSDSKRTALSEATKELLMLFIICDEKTDADRWCSEMAVTLDRFCAAEDIQTQIFSAGE